MRYVAAFRTYTWDDGVAELARRCFRACSGGRNVVLADETRGPLCIPGYEVVSHTDETEYLGLPNHPKGTSLWHNVDYGLYILKNALPDYDYFLTCESDLAVNLNLDPIVAAIASRGIDIVAHQVKPSTEDWYWHQNAAAVFETPWRSLLFFMILSSRAVALLHYTRRRHAIDFRDGKLAAWPFCENFVPSVLQTAGMRFAEISEFADTSHLRFRPRIPLDDERASRPGSLVHSVVARDYYIKSIVKEYWPHLWFSPASELRQALRDESFQDIAEPLRQAFQSTYDHAGLAVFLKEMEAHGMTVPESDDLAYCKPALSSSTSDWSRSYDPRTDAAGANGAHFHDDCGFHTSMELNPWWLVDLLDPFVIDEVVILNRDHCNERFRQFAIQSSLDSNLWLTRHVKLDYAEVSATRDHPHRVPFADPFVARYVRISLLGTGILHLRRVQVFGRGLLPRQQTPAVGCAG
jgi:hypothetical protein